MKQQNQAASYWLNYDEYVTFFKEWTNLSMNTLH